MPNVETVRGPVDAADLGRTLPHEHVFVLQPEALINYGRVWGESYWDEEERVADAIGRLNEVREAGITTIFDPTAPGLGRDIRRIQRINESVDLHIVVASGIYAFLELPGFLGYRSDDQITELFVRELREGIDDTGVKAAFLKCAVEEHGLVGDIPRILRTVAAASVETGAPVMVHTNATFRTGLPALEALTGHGVDPRNLIVAHVGDSNDMDYIREIADSGAWLGCDRFGIDHFNPLDDRIDTLHKMLEAGWEDRIHLSHDAGCFMDFMVENPPFAEENPDYLLLTNTVIPRLLGEGVTQAQIDRMMVDNPRAFLAGPSKP